MLLGNMLLYVGINTDQLFISLDRGEVLHVACSLTAVLIVLIHDHAINEVCFWESLKQLKDAIVGDTKQLRVVAKLYKFLGRNLFKETSGRYHDLTCAPKPFHLLFTFYKCVRHGKPIVKEVGTFSNFCRLQ